MRSLKVETDFTFVVEDVEHTYRVTANYTPGSEAYFDRSFGNWLPGDPPTLEDTDLTPIGAAPPLDYDDLPKDEQEKVDEALLLAIDEEGDD